MQTMTTPIQLELKDLAGRASLHGLNWFPKFVPISPHTKSDEKRSSCKFSLLVSFGWLVWLVEKWLQLL